jgi:small conductance mechanosensitive channel
MRRRLILSIGILVAAGVVTGITVYYHRMNVIPDYLVTPIYVVISLVAGYLVIQITSVSIERLVSPRLGLTRSHALKNFFQIVAAIVLAIIVVSFFGVNLTNWLIGAGFLGIVLGLAAQQILGNLFAGLALLSGRPFEIGERLTLITSTYGIIGMSYPHENLINGYTGVVEDVGIFYTRILTDEGVPLVLPNSVVISSLVMNHSKVRQKIVRVRMDLEKSIDFSKFKEKVASLIMNSKVEESIDSSSLHVEIIEVGRETYQVVMTIWTRTVNEEPVRSFIIQNALQAQRELLGTRTPSGS